MILVDTSVWIRHFREKDQALEDHLSEGIILMHPFVSGELACGNLRDRSTILFYLDALPPAKLASNGEVHGLIEQRKLWGRGLGWIDMHLLASAMLSHCRFWTLDKRLNDTAVRLGLNEKR